MNIMKDESFYNTIERFRDFDFYGYWKKVTKEQVLRSINTVNPSYEDLLNFLSPAAEQCLEEMAVKARALSLRHFGRTVNIYTPIYISNYCTNKCAYCGYNYENTIDRKKLTLEEVEVEAKTVAEKGFRHVILLTGESNVHSPVSYIEEGVKIFKKYFSSITLEVQPMSTEDYKRCVEAGADSLTVFQETYDEKRYDEVHIAGPKKNYRFRLDALERGAKAGMKFISLGALLGLSDYRKDAFFTGLHGEYIRRKYPQVCITYSPPRIRPCSGGLKDLTPVPDKEFVQILLAYKLFQEQSGLNISTREDKEMRRHLIPLGVTKISAGVSTEVGGHSLKTKGTAQFEINDESSLQDIKDLIKSVGYQPVMKDWDNI